jgi:lipopolysaccharide heptosyltransferase II
MGTIKLTELINKFIAKNKIDYPKIKKIAILKTGSIGDVLFTSPAVRALKTNFPDAQLVYIVGSWSIFAAQNNPFVDKILEFPEKGGLFKILLLLLKIRKEHFDLCVNFHRSFQTNFFLWLCKIKWRVGFNWKNHGFLLTHSIPFDSKIHEIKRYLKILELIGIKNTNYQTCIKPSKEALIKAKKLFEIKEIKFNNNSLQKPLLIIFPGGGINPLTKFTAKRWNIISFCEAARRLVELNIGTVAVIGSYDEKDLSDAIMQATNNRIVSFTGETDFNTLVGLLSFASWFIGGDSGPTHIAAALGIPVFSIFGPSDPNLVAPIGEKHKYIWKKTNCAPCYEPETVLNRNFLKCKYASCLEELTINEVWPEIVNHLKQIGLIKE